MVGFVIALLSWGWAEIADLNSYAGWRAVATAVAFKLEHPNERSEEKRRSVARLVLNETLQINGALQPWPQIVQRNNHIRKSNPIREYEWPNGMIGPRFLHSLLQVNETGQANIRNSFRQIDTDIERWAQPNIAQFIADPGMLLGANGGRRRHDFNPWTPFGSEKLACVRVGLFGGLRRFQSGVGPSLGFYPGTPRQNHSSHEPYEPKQANGGLNKRSQRHIPLGLQVALIAFVLGGLAWIGGWGLAELIDAAIEGRGRRRFGLASFIVGLVGGLGLLAWVAAQNL